MKMRSIDQRNAIVTTAPRSCMFMLVRPPTTRRSHRSLRRIAPMLAPSNAPDAVHSPTHFAISGGCPGMHCRALSGPVHVRAAPMDNRPSAAPHPVPIIEPVRAPDARVFPWLNSSKAMRDAGNVSVSRFAPRIVTTSPLRNTTVPTTCSVLPPIATMRTFAPGLTAASCASAAGEMSSTLSSNVANRMLEAM